MVLLAKSFNQSSDYLKRTISEQIKEIETATDKKVKVIAANKKQTVVEFECRDGLSAEVVLNIL